MSAAPGRSEASSHRIAQGEGVPVGAVGRRKLLCTAVAGLSVQLSALAQGTVNLYRIAHLSGSGESASRPFVDAFREGLRTLGLVEGRGYVLEQRYAEGKFERLAALAQELMATRPDVMLVSTTPASLAAKGATRIVPIVVVLVADPVGAGIVQSLARPGGNITGVTNIVAELASKRLELLKELVPGASQVAVFVNPDSQNAPLQLRSATAAARALGLELRPVLEVRRAEDLERAFKSAAQAHVKAAIRMIDPLVFMLRDQTASLAIQYRLPMIYPSREDVQAGGLMAYGTNVHSQYRQAATMVEQILKGTKPNEMPVEQPTTFDLVINLKTAKALGVPVPQSLLLRATEVIG